MSTPLEIITKIKESKSGFKITDDFEIDDDIIYSMMNDVRETLIREEQNNTGLIDPKYYQMTCCNKIECIKQGCEYNGRIIVSNKSHYKVTINGLITKVGDSNIKFIGTESGVRYNKYTYNGFQTISYRLWTKNSLGYTQIGSDILLNELVTPGMKYICALVLLKDPSIACNWEDDNDYPVPSEMKLIDLVSYRLRGNAKDVLNNSADDINPPKIEEQELARNQELIKQNNPQNNG